MMALRVAAPLTAKPASRPAARRSVAARAKAGSSPIDTSEKAEEMKKVLNEGAEIAKVKAKELAAEASAAWEKTEEKPAVVAIAAASFLGLWFAAGVIDSVDKLPVLPPLLELVGLGYTAWFIYRYLIFEPSRAELKDLITTTYKEMTGKDTKKAAPAPAPTPEE
ncbi:unnamed protein product [Pedinophyceae sp. YPF-701]|nr:unnamed protein product [Pedinophyceae sp. YPF-701]